MQGNKSVEKFSKRKEWSEEAEAFKKSKRQKKAKEMAGGSKFRDRFFTVCSKNLADTEGLY